MVLGKKWKRALLDKKPRTLAKLKLEPQTIRILAYRNLLHKQFKGDSLNVYNEIRGLDNTPKNGKYIGKKYGPASRSCKES